MKKIKDSLNQAITLVEELVTSADVEVESMLFEHDFSADYGDLYIFLEGKKVINFKIKN